MRDLILALIILAALVWAFSGTPGKETETDTGMYFPTYDETALPDQSGKAVSFVEGNLQSEPTDTKPKSENQPKPTKTIEELAWEVIIGKWDLTEERKRLLTEAGYDYEAVQDRVNEIMNGGI